MSTTPSNNQHGRLLLPATPNPEPESSRSFQTLLDLLTSDDKSDHPSRWRSFIGCCSSATRPPSPPPETERGFRVSRVCLSKLLEREAEEEEEEEEERRVCCVCRVRKKGAALIPCGHTFCRICSKQVWVNRGSCPLCNRLILDILNIF